VPVVVSIIIIFSFLAKWVIKDLLFLSSYASSSSSTLIIFERLKRVVEDQGK